jgi:hypothetical protein
MLRYGPDSGGDRAPRSRDHEPDPLADGVLQLDRDLAGLVLDRGAAGSSGSPR